MKYQNLNIKWAPNLRAIVNEKILMEAATGAGNISKEHVFNAYSGKGGLHDLTYSDFKSFHDYTEAKKEIERGQFFTPPEIAQLIAEAVEPDGTVLDPTCGSGVFCNFVNEKDFTGIDIDGESISVAKFLYPKAKFEEYNLEYWDEGARKWDYILTNPPFNLRWEDGAASSQFCILAESRNWLKEYGIFAAIVPEKYLKDEFYFSRDVNYINSKYNWLGQVGLPIDAFKNYGVRFPTKVIFFQNTKGNGYSNTFQTWEEIKAIIGEAKQLRRKNMIAVVQSIERKNDYSFSYNQRAKNGGFEFQLRKLLYEIKVHNEGKNYDKALSVIKQYKEQEKPPMMDWKEWNKIALTEAKVLSRLRIYVGFRNRQRRKPETKPANPKQLKPFKEMTPSQEVLDFLETFTFKDKRGEHHLTEIQKEDIGKALMKPYGILNWQQGCGKTPAAYAVAEYRACLNVVVAPALAINGTWKKFLSTNGKTFKFVKKRSDLTKDVDYLLFTYSRMSMNRYGFAKYIKKFLRNTKVQLICDESDEMTNRNSKTYKAVRVAFARGCKYKLLTTGTTTRNNAAELYPQLELLYNNSLNLVDLCDYVTYEEKERGRPVELVEKRNQNYGNRFHPYKGLQQFKRCFSPSKSTVFGIKKQDQDVHNYKELLRILNYTCLVRTFKEVAGDKYKIEQVNVLPSFEESLLQEKILEEFHSMCRNYFANTGNSRKESGLRIIRQLTLLIRSCSLPETFSEYTGAGGTKESKILRMVDGIGEKVCVGCTSIKGAQIYYAALSNQDPFRPIFYIDGSVSFNQRKKLIQQFEATFNGVLVCTQQSLKSSINIPSCNHCIIESLQWNLPKISQFFFRFIRFNSRAKTTVYFVTYSGTIEDNLMALIMTKEKINMALKFETDADVFGENGLDESLLESIMRKEYDKEGKRMQITWGKQKIYT